MILAILLVVILCGTIIYGKLGPEVDRYENKVTNEMNLWEFVALKEVKWAVDKITAIILSILLVVVTMGVIFFDNMAPALDDKSDEVITDLEGFDFNGTN